jgi:hypothetical protein
MNGLTLTRLLWAQMLEEETQHFPRCVGSSRISIEASRAASRPCVSGSMDVPVSKNSAPAHISMDRAGNRNMDMVAIGRVVLTSRESRKKVGLTAESTRCHLLVAVAR